MAIVCGTDFSSQADRVALAALGVAGEPDEPVYLVHVMELPTVAFLGGDGIVVPPPMPPETQELRESLEERLARVARELGPGVVPVLAIGSPEQALLEEADRYHARMIVVGSHGTRGARWLLGSTADRLARSAPLPLLVVRGEARGLPDRGKRRGRAGGGAGSLLKVLVCVDFEEATGTVVACARELCFRGPCEIHFAHSFEKPMGPFAPDQDVASPSAQRAELERLVQDELERLSDRVSAPGEPDPERVHLLRGRPVSTLTRLAAGQAFDVMVSGTHGRRGLDRLLLGSVASGLLRKAPCPVLVAPLPPHPLEKERPAKKRDGEEAEADTDEEREDRPEG